MFKKAKNYSFLFFLLSHILTSFVLERGVAASDDPALSRAKNHFKEGQSFYLGKEYAKAAESFMAAFKEKPFAAFLYNAAVAYEKDANYERAVSLFKRYLEKAPKAEDKAAINKRIKALEKHLAAVGCKTDKDCESGNVCKEGECVAAPVPRPVAKDKCTSDEDCGEEKKCKEGICVSTKEVQPKPGTCTTDEECGGDKVCKNGSCIPEPRAATRPRPRPRRVVLPPIETKGLVLIDSKPQGAKIWLNDKMKPPIGTTPYQGSLPEGKYTVIIEKRGAKPEKRNIEVSSKRLLELYFSLSKEHYLGWIEITSNVPGAQVFIDDLSIGAVGRTPYSGFRKPGRHTIWVKKAGFKTIRREVEIVSGETNNLNVKLGRVTYGWMDLSGKRAKGASVKVNGKKVCQAPCREVKVPAGGHVMTVSRKGHKPLKKTIIVKKGERTQVKVNLIPKPSRVSAYVSYGFAAATLGGAIFAALKAKSIRDEIDEDINSNVLITNKDDRYREGKIYAIVANGLFGVAAIATTVGLYYQFRNPGPKSSAVFKIGGVSISPEIGRRTVALHGTLEF